jgi:hypothetical protein
VGETIEALKWQELAVTKARASFIDKDTIRFMEENFPIRRMASVFNYLKNVNNFRNAT